LPVPVPPLPEQRGIAATLAALDDKTESNRRAIDLQYLLAITLLSDGGGARIRVGDVAAISKGLSYKGSGLEEGAIPGATRMINLANFTTSGQMNADGLKHYSGDFKPTHILSELELVVANTDLTQAREILGRGFLIPPAFAESIHTHHTSVVRFESDKKWMSPFLWAQLQSSEFRERAKGFATGTTVTALPAEALLDFEFTVPSDPSSVADKALALLRNAWRLSDEIESLARMRDTLLPELLSGHIRVPEAEELVAEVGV
jgi:type I restriction enzyme S subunit